MAKTIEFISTVVRRQQPNMSYIILSLKCKEIADSAKPGQFVNLTCNQFLRRPFGIMSVDKKAGEIAVGIRIQGEGTYFLSQLQPGDKIPLLGPLGHGFDLDKYDRVITIGGGTGVFPLFFVQQYCRQKNIEGIAVCGYRSAEESILTEEFTQVACAVSFASDAGDMKVAGHAGLALKQVLEVLKQNQTDLSRTLIAACGPKIMMQQAAEMAANEGVDCQVSLEERMACGIGICLVCVCKTKNPDKQSTGSDDQWQHKRCCVEGPVFDAREVIW